MKVRRIEEEVSRAVEVSIDYNSSDLTYRELLRIESIAKKIIKRLQRSMKRTDR